MKEMISAKEVIKKVNIILDKHKGDEFSPLDDNWVQIVEYLGNYIIEQDRKINEYERVIKSRDNRIKEEAEKFERKELDIPNIPEVIGEMPLVPGYNY